MVQTLMGGSRGNPSKGGWGWGGLLLGTQDVYFSVDFSAFFLQVLPASSWGVPQHACMHAYMCNFSIIFPHVYPRCNRLPAEGCPSMHACKYVEFFTNLLVICLLFFCTIFVQVQPASSWGVPQQACMHTYMCNVSLIFLHIFFRCYRLPAEGCPSMHACIHICVIFRWFFCIFSSGVTCLQLRGAPACMHACMYV